MGRSVGKIKINFSFIRVGKATENIFQKVSVFTVFIFDEDHNKILVYGMLDFLNFSIF